MTVHVKVGRPKLKQYDIDIPTGSSRNGCFHIGLLCG